MAIPGLRPQHEVRAKVRIGEKVEGTRKDGSKYTTPASVDYFICDDADFLRVVGQGKRSFGICLPFAEADLNFSTGLERWDGQMLTCYTKGKLSPWGQVVAYRKPELRSKGVTVNLLDGFEKVEMTAGKDRQGVVCQARGCPDMISKACKPMGRLQFFLPGVDPSRGVYQLDTKSWHSIEGIEALLSVLGDPRGRPLTLSVAMHSVGSSRFPVVSLGVPEVEVDTLPEITVADCLVQLRGRLEDGSDESIIKIALAATLDVTNPNWRSSEAFIDGMKARIEEIGVRAAAEALCERYEL
jgi:hypothetical protein